MSAALDYDRAVPQRDLLLDSDLVTYRLADRLGRAGPLRIDECRRVRVKYRVGARLRVVHRVRVGPSTYSVAASTFPTLERSERAYADACRHAVACGAARPAMHDRELATVFWTFPNDRKIAHLPALAAPARELAELLPAWAGSTLASYAPEKAATVRCLDEAGRPVAYAKVYAGEEGERAARIHDVLSGALDAGDPHLRLPRSLAYSHDYRTLFVEALEGLPIHEAPDLTAAYERLGRALARFHELAPPDDVPFRRLDVDRLQAAADLIGAVRRDVAGDGQALVRDLADRLDPDGGTVCLHGDVNFRNALLENDRVALFDLDQVATGPPCADLGSVLASLRYAGVVGLLPAGGVPGLCRALLAGYSELRTPPGDAALHAYTAAALLGERALRVVTRVRDEGLRRLPALLADAREVLA